MNRQQTILKLRTHRLAVMLIDARQTHRRTFEECAQAMGVSVEEYQSYEAAQAAPSLPALEALAFYLNLPLEHFWSQTTLSAQTAAPSDQVRKLRGLRSRAIGARLRQRRTQLEMGTDTLAEKLSLPLEQVDTFETGQNAIPLPQLELIAEALGLPIQELFDQHGPIGEWRTERELNEKFAQLPAKMKDFVSKPVNRPYLELAMRLSELSVEKLRTVAESLLEITY